MVDKEMLEYVNTLLEIKYVCKTLVLGITSTLEKDSPVPYQTYILSTKLLNLGLTAVMQVRELYIHAVSKTQSHKMKERRKNAIEAYNVTKRMYDEYIESLKPNMQQIVEILKEKFRKTTPFLS